MVEEFFESNVVVSSPYMSRGHKVTVRRASLGIQHGPHECSIGSVRRCA